MDYTAPDLFASYGFSQFNDLPTSETNDTISLIDLFFKYNTENVICHGTLTIVIDLSAVLYLLALEIFFLSLSVSYYLSIDIGCMIELKKNTAYLMNFFD